MAYLTDLRKILGISFDFGTSDLVTGTADSDTINIYGGDDQVIAGDGDDVIFDVGSYTGGLSGRDIVRGGFGNDLIVSSLDTSSNLYDGGAGIDTANFIPNSNGVVVDLAWGTATDRVTQAVSSLISIENVVGTAATDYIFGDGNANRLSGYNGDDLIRGQGGSDQLYGDRGRDVLFGGDQGDALYGGDDDDMLYGDAGNDSLFGDAGNDYVIGGAGNDWLVGGAGRDTFKFAALTDSGLTSTTVDTIGDFVHLTDRIDVADIDARATQTGNQAFAFIGTANFSAAGQIRYYLDAQSQDTIVLFNTDNDSAAEMVLRIDPLTALSGADFVL